MSSTTPLPTNTDQRLEDPKILRLAGGLLFALGIIGLFLGFTSSDVADKAGMALNVAVLLALGYPMLLYVRALTKISALEQRVRELERRLQP